MVPLRGCVFVSNASDDNRHMCRDGRNHKQQAAATAGGQSCEALRYERWSRLKKGKLCVHSKELPIDDD